MITKECLKNKAKKKYPEPCILLVRVKPERPLNIQKWLRVVENNRSSVNGEMFAAMFLVDAWSNIVLELERRRKA